MQAQEERFFLSFFPPHRLLLKPAIGCRWVLPARAGAPDMQLVCTAAQPGQLKRCGLLRSDLPGWWITADALGCVVAESVDNNRKVLRVGR